jgi:hypothetical protein
MKYTQVSTQDVDLTFTQSDPLNIIETASLKMSTQRIRSLKSKNDRLQLEIQRLREELEPLKIDFTNRHCRDEERLEQLMLNGEACGVFSIVCCGSDQL